MPEAIIPDTSSLIALEKINLLPILCKIYSEVIIPQAVINEFGSLSLSCCSVRKVESNLLKLLITDFKLLKRVKEHLGKEIIPILLCYLIHPSIEKLIKEARPKIKLYKSYELLRKVNG